MDFTFTRQEIYEEKDAKDCVNIMIRGNMCMETALTLQKSATQAIWETLSFVKARKRSHATTI
jgi:hypothetical protein